MTSDIALSGVACTSGVTPRQLVQSSSENDTIGKCSNCSINGGFLDKKKSASNLGCGLFALNY